jgi:hypothetical protein
LVATSSPIPPKPGCGFTWWTDNYQGVASNDWSSRCDGEGEWIMVLEREVLMSRGRGWNVDACNLELQPGGSEILRLAANRTATASDWLLRA